MSQNTPDNNLPAEVKIFKQDNKLEELANLASNPEKFELTEKGEVKVEKTTGTPIFADEILMETDLGEMAGMIEVIQQILLQNLVPMNEVQNAMQLMDMLAEQQNLTDPKFHIKLRVNYAVGLWHCLNTSRKFHIFKKDKAMDKRVDELTNKVATFLDMYRAKKKEVEGDNYKEEITPISFKKKSLDRLIAMSDKRDKARANRKKKQKARRK